MKIDSTEQGTSAAGLLLAGQVTGDPGPRKISGRQLRELRELLADDMWLDDIAGHRVGRLWRRDATEADDRAGNSGPDKTVKPTPNRGC